MPIECHYPNRQVQAIENSDQCVIGYLECKLGFPPAAHLFLQLGSAFLDHLLEMMPVPFEFPMNSVALGNVGVGKDKSIDDSQLVYHRINPGKHLLSVTLSAAVDKIEI